MILENIYLKSPVSMQNVLVNLKGWNIQRRRYSKNYQAIFDDVKRRQAITISSLVEYQEKTLRNFLISSQRLLYWKERFRQFGVDPQNKKIFDEIQKLPILSKDQAKANAARILSPELSPRQMTRCHTSGTTGSALIFYMTKEAEKIQWSTWWRYRKWHNIQRETWCGYFGGRSIVPLCQCNSPFWRINHPGRQVMFSAYHLSEKTAGLYLGQLRDRGVPWIHGYPSILSLLAKYKLEQKLPDLPKLRIITTGAENLFLRQKLILREAFGVPIRQHYGQAEGVANISECEQGKLHVDEDYSFVEFYPIDSEAGVFRIIGTNWTNPAFPLFRYDTGDIVKLTEKKCSCGRPGRIVLQIDGRQEDYVILPSGAKVGRLDHIFKDMTPIREAQIHQRMDGSLIFRIVPGPNYRRNENEKQLLAEARVRLGNEIPIEIDYIDSIPRTKSGKLRFVTSDNPDNKI